MGWAVLLPLAALWTRPVAERDGARGVVVLWSTVILVGGVLEGFFFLKSRDRRRPGDLARWVLQAQGNLSLVGVALSGVFLWLGTPEFLPGLWLLLMGHSFHSHGRLALAELRISGWIFQLGGVVALFPQVDPLWTLAVTAAVANLWTAYAVWRRRGQELALEKHSSAAH